MPWDAGRRLEKSRVSLSGNAESWATLHSEASARAADDTGRPVGDGTIIALAEIRRLELGRISLADLTSYARPGRVDECPRRAEGDAQDHLHIVPDDYHLPAVRSGDDGLFQRQAGKQRGAARRRGNGIWTVPHQRSVSVPPAMARPIVSAYLSTVPTPPLPDSTRGLSTAAEREILRASSQNSTREERVDNHKKWLLRKEGERGNTWGILALLQAGVEAASRDEEGRTSCHYAAMNNHSKAIIALANANQDSYVPHNFEDAANDGATALHYAAFNGAVDAAKTILKLHRANIQTNRTRKRDADAARLRDNETQLKDNTEQLSALRARIEELDQNESELTEQIESLTHQMGDEEARFECEHDRLRYNQKEAEESLEAHAQQCSKLEETVLHWKPISRVKYEAYSAEWEKSRIEMSKLEMALLEAVSCVEKEVKSNGKTKRKLSRQLLQAQQSLRATQEKLEVKNEQEKEMSTVHAQLQEENRELHYSVAEFSRKVVHKCKGAHHIEFNAEIHAKARNGSTPLHWAADSGQDEMCHMLLECGADSNASDGDGLTPLHWAAMSKAHASSIPQPKSRGEYLKSSFELLAKGAKCNAIDMQGCSPLHYAAAVGFTDLIEVMKEWGGDASLQDIHGANAVHHAMAQVSFCHVLLSGGLHMHSILTKKICQGHLDTALALVAGIKDLYAAIHVQVCVNMHADCHAYPCVSLPLNRMAC